jgi:hypothetical protein
LEAAFVFGHVGNLGGALISGWSVEESYAWAVGEESVLRLPLPGHDGGLTLRLAVHPLTYPGVRPFQRLILSVGDEEVGSVTLTKRGPIDIPLPRHLTRGRRDILLTLRHPDAIRPSDAGESLDTRELAICFHSGGLLGSTGPSGTAIVSGGLCAGIIAGGADAACLADIINKLPSARGRVEVSYIDTSRPLDSGSREDADRARFCWIQSNVGAGGIRDSLREALAADCMVRDFAIPTARALWPFLGTIPDTDKRAGPEPGRYATARYPYPDRVAAGFAAYNLTDDIVALLFENAVPEQMPDLDALLAADIAEWRTLDQRNTLGIGGYVSNLFKAERLFLAPSVPGPPLLREIAKRLAASPPIADVLDPAVAAAEIDALMEGFRGRREELPVHPSVAAHFNLAWWSADLHYRWHGSRRTGSEYIMDYIRWMPWRP